jgi:hypothetical protein
VREEPIFSGGVIKAALVILIGGALGVGAYALVSGGLDIDLPDLPDIDTVGETTNVEGPTTLQDTTIGSDQPTEAPAAPGDPFTSAGFASALEQVKAEVGSGQQLTRLFINDVQTQFIVRRGEGVEAYSVRADTGELDREEATVTISGNAKLSDFAFSLGAVDPGVLDGMLAAARKQSGVADFEPTVVSLERAIPFGSRRLEWTINAQGGGRNLLYRAAVDGSGVRREGEGSPIPPAAQQAEELNDCIQEANNDPNKIFACLDRFQ